MRSTRPVTALLGICAVIVAKSAAADERTWHFRVFLDDREIGYHDFVARDTSDGQVVDSEAEFRVKILFINAFRYQHHSEERWEDGCLRRIEASTRTNGDRARVEGSADGDGFVLRAARSERRDEADLDLDTADQRLLDTDCLSTFAYWDRKFVDRRQLLNPQTGEVVPVQISELGREKLTISGVETPVLRYRIDMADGAIDVWYTRAGGHWEWVALETQVEGRTLRYEREGGEELPILLSAASVDTEADGVGSAQ